MRLIDPDDLTVQPVWYYARLVNTINFKPGRAAYALPIQALTASLNDDTGVDPQGGFFEYDLDAFVKGVTPGMEVLREKLIGRRIHIEVTYGDGQRRLLPLIRLLGKGRSGKRGGIPQGYTFTGQLQLTRPAPFVTTTFPVIGPPYAPPPDGDTGGSSLTTLEITGSTYTYTIPAGSLLVCIEVQSDAAQMPSIGFFPGSNEIGGPIDLAAGQPCICAGLQVTSLTSTNIHFSGLAGTNTIRLWLLV